MATRMSTGCGRELGCVVLAPYLDGCEGCVAQATYCWKALDAGRTVSRLSSTLWHVEFRNGATTVEERSEAATSPTSALTLTLTWSRAAEAPESRERMLRTCYGSTCSMRDMDGQQSLRRQRRIDAPRAGSAAVCQPKGSCCRCGGATVSNRIQLPCWCAPSAHSAHSQCPPYSIVCDRRRLTARSRYVV